MPATWQVLYGHPLIATGLLISGPILMLCVLALRGFETTLGVVPAVADFVRGWTVVFALVAVLDPVATNHLGWPLLPFVLLGDLRVLVLLFVVAGPVRRRAAACSRAIAWTLVVPLCAYGIYRGVGSVYGSQPEAVLWLLYEVFFVVLCAVLWTRVIPQDVPARGFVGAVLALVAGYYTLWATADVIILSGHDWGWALRVVPNVLYYGVLVPFAYARFFASGPSDATNASVHAAR